MTYEQFIAAYGPEMGEALYFCGLMNGDGTVVIEWAPEDAIEVLARRPYADAGYAW